MATVNVGTIEVYLVALERGEWNVLVLQRSASTRCPGSWETVHGHIYSGEHPEHAAVRELREETGLIPVRLYNVTVQPFYLHSLQVVQLAVVFAAFVAEPSLPVLGIEHQAAEWLSPDLALERMVWPRERSALREIMTLLGNGDAGSVDDVMRVF